VREASHVMLLPMSHNRGVMKSISLSVVETKLITIAIAERSAN
jgi:hypothetical protein